MNIGGSILNSSCPQILVPLEFKSWRLLVRPLPDQDTHALILVASYGEELLAKHPNGFSCHNLAERMIAGDLNRTMEQADYIARCGGEVRSEVIEWAMKN